MEYWMLRVTFSFILPPTVPCGKDTSTLCPIYLVQLSIASLSFFLLKTKGCQCCINELWSGLSVTSREMKWASGKKIGTSGSFCRKSFTQLWLSYITLNLIKIFPLNVGAVCYKSDENVKGRKSGKFVQIK